MEILDRDLLEHALGKGKPTDREITWLFLYLNHEGLNFPAEEFGTADMCGAMDRFIRKKRLDDQIVEEANTTLLPEENFAWIEKKGRQPRWLLHKIRQDEFVRIRASRCPAHLSEREQLIALLDYSSEPLREKKRYLEDLQKEWGHHRANDKKFDWFTKGESKQKLDVAWDYFHEKHPRILAQVPAFKSVQDLLYALDCADFGIDTALLDVERIKRRLKAKQVAARRDGKPQLNLTLEAEDREALKKLAKQEGETMTEVVRWLIQAASQQGMPARPLTSQSEP
jgi:hypothetical protein